MEEITKYVAFDKKEFSSKKACEAHEEKLRANMKPLSELMELRVAPEFRGELIDFEEALKQNGWSEGESSTCCGQKLKIDNFIGSTVYAECEKCKKWMLDITGPDYSNGAVMLVDHAKYDTSDPKRFIVGIRP